VTLQNSILAGNTGGSSPDCSGTIGSAGYNLVGNTSGCTFTPGIGDLTNASANLSQLIGPTGAPRYHPLLSGSLAIDAGNPAGCTGSTGPLTTDQRGATRVGRCDIGAYEYTIPGPAANVSAVGGTPQRTPPSFAFSTPLQAAVLDSVGSPVNNATVTFSAPASGASGTFADSDTFTTTAVTAESGVATAAIFTANGLTGGYTVTATTNGVVTSANFLLLNTWWYVAPDGDNSNDCLSPGNVCATINGALNKPGFVAGDTILVVTGTYTGTGTEVVLLDKNATLSGGWDAGFTAQSGMSTIDGEGARHGISVNSGATAVVEGFVVQNGAGSAWPGAILNFGTLTLSNSAISGNPLTYGIRNNGTMILNNSTVSGNNVGIADTGTMILNNSTVSSNTGWGDGGGIYGGGTMILNNSTVSDNTASGNGGGIYGGGTVTMQNTIVAGNTAAGTGPDCGGIIGSAGYNIIGNTSDCTFSPTTGDLINMDAKLGPLEGSPGYHPLLPDSPAINAGNPAGCTDHLGNPLLTDQRRFPRFGRCDVGAYEIQPIEYATKIINSAEVTPGGALTYTIVLTNGDVIDMANVHVTDTLPLSITYTSGSLTASNGSYGYSSGVVTWTGTVNAGEFVTITFGATASHTLATIVNAAIIDGGGEIITRAVTVNVGHRIYLPVVIKSPPPPAPPSKPSLSLANANGSSNYSISWSACCNVTGYTLQEATSWDLGNATVIYQGAGTSYNVTNKPVGIYFYRVKAINAGGDSPWSNTAIISVLAPTGGSIYGRVTYMGNASSATYVHLRHCGQTGVSYTCYSMLVVPTQPDGTYSFANARTLGANEYYYVRFSGYGSSYLRYWKTKHLFSYTAGQTIQAGDFDIANVWPRAPWDGNTCALPCTFQWDRRPASPSDSYYIELWGDNDLWWENPSPLGYVNSYQLGSLPTGFSTGVQYLWDVAIAGPNGEYGYSYQAWGVSFSGDMANPQVEIVPGRPLSEEEIDNLIELREKHLYSSTSADDTRQELDR